LHSRILKPTFLLLYSDCPHFFVGIFNMTSIGFKPLYFASQNSQPKITSSPPATPKPTNLGQKSQVNAKDTEAQKRWAPPAPKRYRAPGKLGYYEFAPKSVLEKLASETGRNKP
jgi:hypothetical protein